MAAGHQAIGDIWASIATTHFEKTGSMRHKAARRASRPISATVAMKLDHAKFCDLIVDVLETLVGQKA